MKERMVWLMVIAICLLGYIPTANAIDVGESDYEDWSWAKYEVTHTMTGFSFTPGSGDVLVVMVHGGHDLGSVTNSVTFAGEAFPGGNVIYSGDYGNGSGDDSYADIWWLVNPAASSGDIVITMSSAVGENEGEGLGVVILHGVDTDDPLTASAITGDDGDDNFGEVTISPVAGGILIDSFWCNFGLDPLPVTSGAELIYRDDSMPAGGTAAASYRKITVGGSQTERWEIFDGEATWSPRFVLTVAAFAPDQTINPPPEVDAGPNQNIWWPDTHIATLAGSASDLGPMDGTSPGSPGGVTSLYWVHTGPGTATFDPSKYVVNPDVLFTLPGTHELMLQVSDGYFDVNDTMTIIATQPALIGHWPFDNSAVDASMNSNDGTLAEVEGGYPYYSTDAAIGSHSISLDDPNSTEPNRPHIALGAATELDFGVGNWTISAWIKTTGQTSQAVIFGNGADHAGGTRYGLYNNEGSTGIVGLLTDDNEVGGSDPPYGKNTASADNRVDDGQWHFVLGKRDGDRIRIYRDGTREDSQAVPVDYDLSGTSAWPVYIGIITHAETGLLTKQFNGLIDDVRVYDYALNDPNILALAAMAPLPPVVNAGSNSTFRLQPNELYSTAATVTDNGAPGIHTYLWTCVGRPDAGDNDANAIFTSPTVMNTDVEFPYFGVYTLRLTVTDTVPATSVGDNVVLTLLSTLCVDVPANLVGDISGPGGAALADCYVDLHDIAKFAADFMSCNDPENLPTCEVAPLIPLP